MAEIKWSNTSFKSSLSASKNALARFLQFCSQSDAKATALPRILDVANFRNAKLQASSEGAHLVASASDETKRKSEEKLFGVHSMVQETQ